MKNFRLRFKNSLSFDRLSPLQMKSSFWGLAVLMFLIIASGTNAWAQDPGGQDTVYVYNSYAAIDESQGGKVRIEIWIKTDNTGFNNDIAGMTVPLQPIDIVVGCAAFYALIKKLKKPDVFASFGIFLMAIQ